MHDNRIDLMRTPLAPFTVAALMAGAMAVVRTQSAVDRQAAGPAQTAVSGRAVIFAQSARSAALQSVRRESGRRFASVAGVAFWTTEIEPLERGYDGPIKMLVGMDTKGILTGVIVVEHHEPYGDFSVEPPEFAAQFKGKSIRDPFKVGADVDAVSRATISITSATRAIRNSARRMATQLLTPAARNDAAAVTVCCSCALLAWRSSAQPRGIVTAVGSRRPPPPIPGASTMTRRRSKPGSRSRGQAMDLVLFAAFAALALVSFFRKSVALKTSTSSRRSRYLGFYKSQLIRSSTSSACCDWNLPIFRYNLGWYLFAVFTVVSTVLWGRLYCGRICAFGALTQLLDPIVPAQIPRRCAAADRTPRS